MHLHSRVGWNGTPHYRRAGGRLFGSRNPQEIERVFVFNPKQALEARGASSVQPDGRADGGAAWPFVFGQMLATVTSLASPP